MLSSRQQLPQGHYLPQEHYGIWPNYTYTGIAQCLILCNPNSSLNLILNYLFPPGKLGLRIDEGNHSTSPEVFSVTHQHTRLRATQINYKSSANTQLRVVKRITDYRLSPLFMNCPARISWWLWQITRVTLQRLGYCSFRLNLLMNYG